MNLSSGIELTNQTTYFRLFFHEVSLDADSGTRTIYPTRLNKRLSSMFHESYMDWQIPEEGQRAKYSKCYDNKKGH